MSYNGIVCRLKVREHPNADKLAVASANGFQVIVSKDTPDDAVGVFFMADTQLSHELCMEASLYRKDPVTGESLGGYLESNRRVRSIKLRGEISEGLWIPVYNFSFLNKELKVGDLVGEPIAQKFIPQHIRRWMEKRDNRGKRPVELEFPSFKKHYTTSQLRMNLGRIRNGALVVLTEKLHGTSGRSGYLQREKKLSPPWWAFWRKEKLVISYERVYGSRNVAFFDFKEPVSSNPDSHGDSLKKNYRLQADTLFNLHEGETVYYEIVGWESESTPIMSPHKLGDQDSVHKELSEEYDTDYMIYNYGLEPGYWEVYVYRITMTTPEGVITELSWDQVINRCHQLGVKHVPEIGRFIMGTRDCIDKESLLDTCSYWARDRSTLGDHIREGVCVRVMSPTCDEVFKYKGFEFCHLEGISKQDEEYIDIEDIS